MKRPGEREGPGALPGAPVYSQGSPAYPGIKKEKYSWSIEKAFTQPVQRGETYERSSLEKVGS